MKINKINLKKIKMKENNIKITNNNSNQKQIIVTDSNHIKNIFEKKDAGEKLSSTKMKVISIIFHNSYMD
jgi:hypothetical protein